jgi:hypothetical protein
MVSRSVQNCIRTLDTLFLFCFVFAAIESQTIEFSWAITFY